MTKSEYMVARAFEVTDLTFKQYIFEFVLVVQHLPKLCAKLVFEEKYRPSPRSPSLTTPCAVMKTLAGLISRCITLQHQTKKLTALHCLKT